MSSAEGSLERAVVEEQTAGGAGLAKQAARHVHVLVFTADLIFGNLQPVFGFGEFSLRRVVTLIRRTGQRFCIALSHCLYPTYRQTISSGPISIPNAVQFDGSVQNPNVHFRHFQATSGFRLFSCTFPHCNLDVAGAALGVFVAAVSLHDRAAALTHRVIFPDFDGR